MKGRFALGIAGLTGVAIAAYAALAPGKLTIGGKTVDTTFIVQGGRTFVPLSDVAKALDTKVEKTDGGFVLPEVGAGSMVVGDQGKLGQMMGTPQMQFTARTVILADTYKLQYGSGTYNAFDANMQLVVIMCRVRNATNKTINICTVGGAKTALADVDEHTYQVYGGDGPRNMDILPGSVIDFGLVFRAPKSEKLKALVYETDGFPQKKIFRVSLAQPDPGAEAKSSSS